MVRAQCAGNAGALTCPHTGDTIVFRVVHQAEAMPSTEDVTYVVNLNNTVTGLKMRTFIASVVVRARQQRQLREEDVAVGYRHDVVSCTVVTVAMAQGRYGKVAARIIRLLLEKKQLEEKHVCPAPSVTPSFLTPMLPHVRCRALFLVLQIGELLMISGKETRKELYKLLSGRVVHLQVSPYLLFPL